MSDDSARVSFQETVCGNMSMEDQKEGQTDEQKDCYYVDESCSNKEVCMVDGKSINMSRKV